MKSFKAILTLLLAFALIFTVAGCGSKPEDSTSVPVADNDDFFADAENVIENNSSTTGDNNSTVSVNKNNSSTSSKNQTTASAPSGNKTGGKSWSEVLTSMPKSLRGTSITIYNWNPISEYTGASEAVKKFENETGIKVNWYTANYEVYFSRLASLVAAGTSPDVARTNTPGALGLQSFQPISATGYDFTDEAWDQNLMKAYTANGKVYATNLQNSPIGSVIIMYYNKALIDKHDLEDPYKLWKNGKWTWNKFLDMCEEYRSVSGAEFPATGNNYDMWAPSFGIQGPVGFDGTKYYSMLGDATFLQATQKIADLYHTSKIIGHFKVEEFDKGEILFFASGAIHGRRKNAYFASLKANGSLYAVPMPAVDGQSKYYQGTSETEAYALVQGAKNAKAVPYFLRYFLDAANYDMNAFFVNNQTREAYNWAMSQKNTVWPNGYGGGATMPTKDKFAEVVNYPGSQVKSFIDSNKAVIDKRVSDLNAALAKLK